MERGEWVLLKEKIPLAQYEKLYNGFDPRNFDADLITDLALEAGMKYINLVSCHHDGFPLWQSKPENWNSYNACGRDLVQELGKKCDEKGLGFFLYFTHLINWRHPAAMPIGACRPEYDPPEERYLSDPQECKEKFWQWSHSLMKELCSFDFPVAGVWLDIISTYYRHPEMIPIEKTYKLLNEGLPAGLTSFKQGATGTEDYASSEFAFHSVGVKMREKGFIEAADIADKTWNANKTKHNEICMTMQESGWGYNKESRHYSADEIRARLAYATMNKCNMLCNVGPLPDGSIHPDDIKVLKACGKDIREKGWPGPEEAITTEQLKNGRKKSAAAALVE